MLAKFLKYTVTAVFVAFGAIAVASPASAASGTQAATPIGVWLFQNNRFAIEIDACGDQLCGKVSWLKAPYNAQGRPRIDSANSDPSLRTRPVLGLTVLSGLRRAADGSWEDGEIYNPDDGSRYQASVSMNDDGTLRVRAYMGIPLIGKTLNLTRMS